MTEGEARNKWCPFSRVISATKNKEAFSNAVGNRINTLDDLAPKIQAGSQCIASMCMAWRQDKKPNPEWKPDYIGAFPSRDTRFDQPYIDDPTSGHCGLAGQ